MNQAPPKWLLEDVRQARKGAGRQPIEETDRLIARFGLATVCRSARCPNRGACFSERTATFLILGEVCTRRCTFCAVRHGPPSTPDEDEPRRVALTIAALGLKHAVITSVTRDDLPDGGARHFAAVVGKVRRQCPGGKIEVLVPDFGGSEAAFQIVAASGPDVLAHNLETVPRLYETVRRGADYRRSLDLLKRSKDAFPSMVTKSGLMLGLGEQDAEIEEVLSDLAGVRCDMVTLGQYLAPSPFHAPVSRYLSREEFEAWRAKAEGLGFRSVASGALVRSSYKAPIFFKGLA